MRKIIHKWETFRAVVNLRLMIWACFAATQSGNLAVIELMMNSSVYQSVQCEAIWLTAKAKEKMGHSAEQKSQEQQQIYNRVCEKEKNQGAAVAQPKPRLQPE